MIVVAFLIWAVFAVLYIGLIAVLAFVAWVFCRRHGYVGIASAVLWSVVAAMVFAPFGCAELYIPVDSQYGFDKPRLIDSALLAYAISWVSGFVLTLIPYLLANHWRERQQVVQP